MNYDIGRIMRNYKVDYSLIRYVRLWEIRRDHLKETSELAD